MKQWWSNGILSKHFVLEDLYDFDLALHSHNWMPRTILI